MTIQELIERLQKFPGDLVVVKSDEDDNFLDIESVDENTAYDVRFVVID